MTTPPDQFYTGLVAELYDALAGEKPEPRDYARFIERSGQPALEPFCGSGRPLIDLVRMGYDVDGVDSSADMLARLKREASDAGLEVNVVQGDVTILSLERRYRSIFIAGASLTLLPDDDAARAALQRFSGHLEPGGSVMIPLETLSERILQRGLGHFREERLASGDMVRCGVTAVECDEVARDARITLRYERLSDNGPEVVERVWERHWWHQDTFREMLAEAGFDRITCLGPDGSKATPADTTFVFLAQKHAS